MIVIFIDCGAFARLAWAPAIAPQRFTPTFAAATAAPPAAFPAARLKIPARIPPAPARAYLASAAALTAVISALAALRIVASAPPTFWLTRTGSRGHRRGR